jgi:RNA polymerase sigma factor (sigma-70 family)
MRQKKLTESEIINGFRRGNAAIIHEYFYGYCQIGYHIFDQKYHLSEKENLDFLSLAHQYAIYLMEHDWKPLEDHNPNVSFKTWFINGFRFVVLDALKWYQKEYGSITFEDYLQSFDVTSDLRLQFNSMVQDICDHASLNRQERVIINMLLLNGFKAKEIAAQMGMTPSAISQKYKKLKEEIIAPYFRKYFDMDMDTPEVMDERIIIYGDMQEEAKMVLPTMIEEPTIFMNMEQKRTTPEFITELQPNEIFVFGSNLKGMHGGGAAYIAYRKFGAIMGQGVGLQGQSYAIPTMQGGVETIRPYVDEFIEFAKGHRNNTFLVTRIGCGIAGFTDEEIAPLFEEAHGVDNIVLPKGW